MPNRFLVIVFATILSLFNLSAIEAKSKKPKKIGFELEDCTRVEAEPDIYICLKGEAGDGVLTEYTLRSVNSKTTALVNRYKARTEKKAIARKFSVATEMSDDECWSMYGMSCADYDSTMTGMDETINTATDAEQNCWETYGMSCADYDSTMTGMDETINTFTDTEQYCWETYGMSCADYDSTITGI